jgi:hypothetical protein
MMADAFFRRADIFIMLTNDSDQAETLRVLKNEIRVQTGLIVPMETARCSKELAKTFPTLLRCIKRNDLEVSQFPRHIHDKHGTIERPQEWS